MKSLRESDDLRFKSLFPNGSEKSELVATFLALLELIKDRRVRVEGDDDNARVIMLKEDESLDEQ